MPDARAPTNSENMANVSTEDLRPSALPHRPDPRAAPAELRVDDVMSRPVRSIAADASLKDALETMNRHHIRHLMVAGPDGTRGLVSDRDIRLQMPSRAWATQTEQALIPNSLSVDSVCIRNPVVVETGTMLRTVAEIMLRRKVGSVLVGDERAVVGIVTKADFVRLFLERQ